MPSAEATIHGRAVVAQSDITAGPLQGPLATSVARDRAARCTYPVHHVVHRRRVTYRVAAVAPPPPPPPPPPLVPVIPLRPVYVYGPPVIYRPFPTPFVYRPFYRPYYRPYFYRPFY